MTDFKNIPVYIISFNRLSCLKQLVARLERAGYSNIHIVDNGSSYPPLLEELDKTPHVVHRMKKTMDIACCLTPPISPTSSITNILF